jgi:hypothetical protein
MVYLHYSRLAMATIACKKVVLPDYNTKKGKKIFKGLSLYLRGKKNPFQSRNLLLLLFFRQNISSFAPQLEQGGTINRIRFSCVITDQGWLASDLIHNKASGL